MSKKKENRGGKRIGAGRKKIVDKKVNVAIYPRQSRINLLGMDKVKELACSTIEREYYKHKKII